MVDGWGAQYHEGPELPPRNTNPGPGPTSGFKVFVLGFRV